MVESAKRFPLAKSPYRPAADEPTLKSHGLPGNARELRNVVEGAVILCRFLNSLLASRWALGRPYSSNTSSDHFRRRSSTIAVSALIRNKICRAEAAR